MVALLVSFALAQQGDSYFRALPPIDATNGFYNYVQAGERLRKAKYARTSLRDLAATAKTTPLAIAIQQADTFRDVLPMIELGNTKAVFEPRKSETLATLYPELSGFKSIATLASTAAYAEYARGRFAEGYRWLVAGLRMSRRVPRTDMLHFNVALSCGVSLHHAILEHQTQLSIGQLSELNGMLGEVPGPELYQGIWQKERADYLELPFAIITDLAGTGVRPEDRPKIRPIREGDRATFLALSRIWYADLHREGLAAIQRPEREWLAKPADEAENGDKIESFIRYMKSQKIETDVAFGFLFAADIVEKLGTDESDLASLEFLLKARAQHRLMRAHLALASYRLAYRRYPNMLAEAGIENDPLTGKPFTYTLLDDKSYRLESAGIADTGPIRVEPSPVPTAPGKLANAEGRH